MLRLLGCLGLAAAAALACATPAGADYTATVNEWRIWDVHAINQLRVAWHLPQLPVAGDLNSAAQGWANQLARTGSLAHGALPCWCGWMSIGQNVGEGPRVSAIEWAFEHSPEHRANELDPGYRQLGVGVAENRGVWWVVQDYRG